MPSSFSLLKSGNATAEDKGRTRCAKCPPPAWLFTVLDAVVSGVCAAALIILLLPLLKLAIGFTSEVESPHAHQMVWREPLDSWSQ